MKHTVEIADVKGNTMYLSITLDNLLRGGSWRSLTKGMIKYNSGWVVEGTESGFGFDHDLQIFAHGGWWGIQLFTFVSCLTVNDKGVGVIEHPWVLGLEAGPIDWSIV